MSVLPPPSSRNPRGAELQWQWLSHRALLARLGGRRAQTPELRDDEGERGQDLVVGVRRVGGEDSEHFHQAAGHQQAVVGVLMTHT